jgi:hypothetical protein
VVIRNGQADQSIRGERTLTGPMVGKPEVIRVRLF